MTLLVAGLVCAACAGTALASGFQVKLSSTRVAPGARVTVTTTPSLRCKLTLTIAGRRFTHVMPYGWIQIKMPANFRAGRVPVSVSCGGQTVSRSFTVK